MGEILILFLKALLLKLWALIPELIKLFLYFPLDTRHRVKWANNVMGTLTSAPRSAVQLPPSNNK
jgi:hypothetical protein